MKSTRVINDLATYGVKHFITRLLAWKNAMSQVNVLQYVQKPVWINMKYFSYE